MAGASERSLRNVRPAECGIQRAALALLVMLAGGCGSSWTLRARAPEIPMQWPYQPNSAKLTYLRSITGFVPHRAAAALGAFVFGAESGDRNALVLPVAVATGSDGRLAVADLGRRCVHLYVPAEQRYLQLTGSAERRLASPVGVVFDRDLRLHVADSAGRVFVFASDGGLLATFDRAGAAPLQRPTGIAYSPERDLIFVADTLAHRVYALSTSGDFVFAFGERGDRLGQLNFPTHLFRAPSGEIFVTDALNFRIVIFDEDGRPKGSFGQHGDGSGDIAMPKGVAVDADGVIYVVDGIFDNVQLFNRRGDFLLTLGRRGVDFGEFWLPSGTFISPEQELYVCDTYNARVQVFRIEHRHGEAP